MSLILCRRRFSVHGLQEVSLMSNQVWILCTIKGCVFSVFPSFMRDSKSASIDQREEVFWICYLCFRADEICPGFFLFFFFQKVDFFVSILGDYCDKVCCRCVCKSGLWCAKNNNHAAASDNLICTFSAFSTFPNKTFLQFHRKKSDESFCFISLYIYTRWGFSWSKEKTHWIHCFFIVSHTDITVYLYYHYIIHVSD